MKRYIWAGVATFVVSNLGILFTLGIATQQSPLVFSVLVLSATLMSLAPLLFLQGLLAYGLDRWKAAWDMEKSRGKFLWETLKLSSVFLHVLLAFTFTSALLYFGSEDFTLTGNTYNGLYIATLSTAVLYWIIERCWESLQNFKRLTQRIEKTR